MQAGSLSCGQMRGPLRHAAPAAAGAPTASRPLPLLPGAQLRGCLPRLDGDCSSADAPPKDALAFTCTRGCRQGSSRGSGLGGGRAAAAAGHRTCRRPPHAWMQSMAGDVGVRRDSHPGRGLVATPGLLSEQEALASVARLVERNWHRCCTACKVLQPSLVQASFRCRPAGARRNATRLTTVLPQLP